jgi:catechol 2,3-dioxygenase-like lactoylglutathione lyase family enzyme
MTAKPALVAQLGEVMQLAFVPKDFQGALDFWTKTMGVGPFYLNEKIVVDDLRYRGRPSDIDFRVAIGYWGDIQVEIIEQRNDAPSIYKDWRDAGHEGLQHVCVVVDDMAKAREICRKAGAEVVQEGKLPGGEFIYVDTGGGPGTMVEVIQLPQAGLDRFAWMREQARTWDGSDPVRTR